MSPGSVPVQCACATPAPPLVQQCPYSACPVSMHCPVQPPCSVPVQCLCSVPRAVPIQCPVQCPCNAPMQRPVQCPCAAPRAVPPVQCPCSVGLYAREGSCGLWIHFVTRQKTNSLWQSRVGQGRRPQSLGRRCPRRRDRCSDSVTHMLLMTVSGHLICVPGTLFQGSVKSRIHNYLINLMNVPN